jgi:hypothetical protein
MLFQQNEQASRRYMRGQRPTPQLVFRLISCADKYPLSRFFDKMRVSVALQLQIRKGVSMRESIAALAEEYGRTPQEIEEAIGWERALPLSIAA